MRFTHFMLGLTLSAFSLLANAADLLTAPDLEKVAGLNGVHLVPKDQAKGAGGELNFAGADNKLVAMVMIQDKGMFDFWKKQFGKDASPVANLEPESFQTKPGAAIAYVVFRKGGKSIWIQSMGWKKGGGANFTDSQLADLARLAASRL